MGERVEMEQREGSKGGEQREGSKGRGAKGREAGRFNINQFHFTLGTRQQLSETLLSKILMHCYQEYHKVIFVWKIRGSRFSLSTSSN